MSWPGATAYLKARVEVRLPESYAARAGGPPAPASSSSSGEPRTTTGALNSTDMVTSSPAPYVPSGELTQTTVGGRCGASATDTANAANAVPVRLSSRASPYTNPSETLTLNAWIPPSYTDGVHTNVPFGSTVAPAGTPAPSSPYRSRCAGTSASLATMSKRISASSAASTSRMASTTGGSLSSATHTRTARMWDAAAGAAAAAEPSTAALTANSCKPLWFSAGVHESVPFARAAAPAGGPIQAYDTPAGAAAVAFAAAAAAAVAFTSIRTARPSSAATVGTGRILTAGSGCPPGSIQRAALAAREAAVPGAGNVRFAALPLPSMMEAPGPASASDPAPAWSRYPGPAPAGTS